jgi:rhomboid family GlyGly-CTERM serine protease
VRRDGAAWVALAALLFACAIVGGALPQDAIDWQPALAWREPWRAFSAVGVHYSQAHLLGNLGGLLLTGLFGWVARTPGRVAAAWAAAWPLTQFGLLAKPALAHYGGLSGVLHAGVAAAATGLLLTGTKAQRAMGGLVLCGLAIKVLGESPWGEALRQSPQLGIAVAPLAHATGAVAGLACATIAVLFPHRAHD